MVGALDPSCSRSVFIANLSENVVRRTEIAASAVANFFVSFNHCLVECSL